MFHCQFGLIFPFSSHLLLLSLLAYLPLMMEKSSEIDIEWAFVVPYIIELSFVVCVLVHE